MIDCEGNRVMKGDVVVVRTSDPLLKGQVLEINDRPMASASDPRPMPYVVMRVVVPIVPGAIIKCAQPEKQ